MLPKVVSYPYQISTLTHSDKHDNTTMYDTTYYCSPKPKNTS